MNILEKHFPNLLALANSTETNPMQILRTCANAIVEASEIATHLQSIRDEITALRDQVASADKAWTDALASRDRAVDELERRGVENAAMAQEYAAFADKMRSDLEIVNYQRLENERFIEGLSEKLKGTESALSLAKADLEQTKELHTQYTEDWRMERSRLEADRTSKDGVILKLIEERDAATALFVQVQTENGRTLAELNALYAKYEALQHKLSAIEDILTA